MGLRQIMVTSLRCVVSGRYVASSYRLKVPLSYTDQQWLLCWRCWRSPFLQQRTLSAGETLKASRYIFQVKTIRRILVVMLQLSITLSVVAGSMKERLKPSRHCCSFLRCSKSATQKRGPSISRTTDCTEPFVQAFRVVLQLVWAHFTATAVFFFCYCEEIFACCELNTSCSGSYSASFLCLLNTITSIWIFVNSPLSELKRQILKILMGILTPSGGKIKISIVNLLGSFYPNKK